MPDLHLILYLISLVSFALLGFIVFRQNPKGTTHRVFALLAFTNVIWLFDLFLEQIGISQGVANVWLARISIFLSVPQVMLILLLVNIVPKDNAAISRVWLDLLSGVGILIMVLTLTPWVFVNEVIIGNHPETIAGPLAWLFGLFMNLICLFILFLIIHRLRRVSGIIKGQLLLMFIGLIVMLGFLSFTILLPVILFNNPVGLPFIPVYILIFLFFTAIAILKYQLFNIKLLVTEILALTIPTLLFVQFFIFDFKGPLVEQLLSYTNLKNLEIFLGALTFLLSGYLGFIVLVKNYRSWTNRLFFLLTLFINFYIVINFLSLHPPGGQGISQLFWVRMVMFVCSFIGPSLLVLVLNFPSDHFVCKWKHIVPILVLMAISAASSLLPWVFTGIQYPGGQPLPTPGFGMPMFLLDFAGLFVVSFLVLINKYYKAQGELKKQVGYFMLGAIVTFSFMALSTVISVVFLKSSSTVFLGPISAILLIVFIAFGIIKHHIFNIKILAIEFLAALIAIALITEGVLSGSIGESIFKLIFAALVGLLGLWLVKSVRKEIEQEKKIIEAETLAESNRRLLDLDRQKTEFLNIAAHQLRTPVSIIGNYVSMMQDGDFGEVPEKLKEVHDHIYQSNQWLVRLADEFLNISRLEAGETKYHFGRGDVGKIVRQVVDELKPRARQKGLFLNLRIIQGGLDANFDEEKMRHIVLNFTENAIKYTDTGGVDVLAQEEGGGVSVSVKDTGIGFSDEDSKSFFQKFQRGKNAHQFEVNTSTGLGLYIARKFVEGHYGRVWANSDGPGKGSEFGFWIPTRRNTAVAAEDFSGNIKV